MWYFSKTTANLISSGLSESGSVLESDTGDIMMCAIVTAGGYIFHYE